MTVKRARHGQLEEIVDNALHRRGKRPGAPARVFCARLTWVKDAYIREQIERAMEGGVSFRDVLVQLVEGNPLPAESPELTAMRVMLKDFEQRMLEQMGRMLSNVSTGELRQLADARDENPESGPALTNNFIQGIMGLVNSHVD